MSNTQVGNIYQQIIADVVESSRVDFEEGGVDENVLEELRQGWQQKLSQLNVATFPWDPKPEPIVNPPTLSSNAATYQNSQPQASSTNVASGNNSGASNRVKLEPVDISGIGGVGQPQFQPELTMPANATPAQQRAALNLQASYGDRATASINAIQGNVGQQQGQNSQQNMQRMQQPHPQQVHQMSMPQQQQQQQQRPQGVSSQRPQVMSEQYRQALAAQTAQQRFQNGAPGGQTDGADDDATEANGVIKRFDSNGKETTMGRIEIDNMIREQILSMGTSMEGGGLMVPIHKAAKKGNKASRKSTTKPPNVAQFDGPGSDDDDDNKDSVLGKYDEVDEDAINSDLDDPDEGPNEDDDDEEGMGHIMLCMYDKVQRVKNKWKCVMKDGVLTVNGKEYVFHKASGEYEW